MPGPYGSSYALGGPPELNFFGGSSPQNSGAHPPEVNSLRGAGPLSYRGLGHRWEGRLPGPHGSSHALGEPPELNFSGGSSPQNSGAHPPEINSLRGVRPPNFGDLGNRSGAHRVVRSVPTLRRWTPELNFFGGGPAPVPGAVPPRKFDYWGARRWTLGAPTAERGAVLPSPFESFP